jgi:2-hydroxychromene-2-carboxylate isomerase
MRGAFAARELGVFERYVDEGEATEASVACGTFGSPTFFVNGEIWFGKDRLRDVEEAILAAQKGR